MDVKQFLTYRIVVTAVDSSSLYGGLYSKLWWKQQKSGNTAQKEEAGDEGAVAVTPVVVV